jgi:hypothetical protein
MSAEPFTLSSEAAPAKRQRLIPESVELLIEHPFADRKWVLAKELQEPQWFLLCTIDGQVLALHESQFRSRGRSPLGIITAFPRIWPRSVCRGWQ